MNDKRAQGFPSEQGAMLQAFSRALTREAHILFLSMNSLPRTEYGENSHV